MKKTIQVILSGRNGSKKLKTAKNIADRIFEAKKERRKALARLSVPEKVKILVELQKIASPVLVARGIRKKPWVI